MPGAPASAPRDPHRSAEAADCNCSSGHSGKSADATPPVRSYSWRARRRLAVCGLCLNCGRIPPADGAKYCSGSIERRRASDRKAARKRRLLRRNRGLCAECGAVAGKPGRRLCAACGKQHREASRLVQRRRRDERREAGLCVRCAENAPAEGNASCDDCLARRRRAYRARIDRRRRRCPNCQPLTARRDRDAAKRRREARRAVGLCTVCGQHSAVRGRTACEACLADWLAQYNRKTLARVAQGLCIRCGKETPEAGFTACEPCWNAHRASNLASWRRRAGERRAMQLCIRCGEDLADGQQEVCEACRETRRRSARRRADRLKALGVCVRCGRRPAERGTRDCGPCRDRQRAYDYRGMPDLRPRYTVIEIATGIDHGSWETVQEVAGALACAKLTLDDVEIITDAAPMAAFRSW